MRAAIGILILSLLALAPAAAEGCGDKFQRVGRGARFQRGYVALHPAGVILFAPFTSRVGKALRDLEKPLKRAGHQPLLVERPDALVAELRSGRYDVVMADVDDAAAILERAREASVPPPAILPVLHRPSEAQKATVEEEYNCLVIAPGKQVDVLAEIDGLMEARVTGGAATPKR
jgi:hypothetical protein